jgi:hypothetical protein
VSVAAVAADDPEIVGVVKNDLRLADGGETKQEWRIGLRCGCSGKGGDEAEQ